MSIMLALQVFGYFLLFGLVIAQYDSFVDKSADWPPWLIELEKKKNHTGGNQPEPPPLPPPPGNGDPDCPNDVIHDRLGNQGYFFSWLDPRSKELKVNWQNAVRFCRARCLELVSIETWQEEGFIAQHIESGQQTDIWTSGRKCDFKGCDQPDLQPADIYGWFWEGSHIQLPPTTDRFDVNWSDTGELGEPQPDNAEGTRGGENESCLAILNNAYDDGIRWHDEVCTTRRSFVCEERTQWSPGNTPGPIKPSRPHKPHKPNRPKKPAKPQPAGWPVLVPKDGSFQYRLIVPYE